MYRLIPIILLLGFGDGPVSLVGLPPSGSPLGQDFRLPIHYIPDPKRHDFDMGMRD
jgi:hypothetical protein